MLFTIVYLGFTPKISNEELDSAEPRIQKIVRLISSSKFAIHDLSRLQAREVGEFYRLNMPFELGIDVGCRLFDPGRGRQKRCLVLEAQRFRYQAALSDLVGSDIAVHEGSPERLVAVVRNWLSSQHRARFPGPSRVWSAFLDFTADNYDQLVRQGFSPHDIEVLPVTELLPRIEEWVARVRKKAR